MSQRKREFALQAALGATPARIFRGIVAQNVLLSGTAGSSHWLLAVPLSGRLGAYFARPSMWGVNVSRELVLAGGLGVLLVASLLAAYGPAFRASRMDAVEALRAE